MLLMIHVHVSDIGPCVSAGLDQRALTLWNVLAPSVEA